MTLKISVSVLGLSLAAAAGCGAPAESTQERGVDPPAVPVTADQVAAVDVPALITSTGCLACHSLHGKGGAVGPPLESLEGKDERYVRRAIENPSADTAAGFEAFAGTMPATFADILTPAELEALVRFLLAGAPQGG